MAVAVRPFPEVDYLEPIPAATAPRRRVAAPGGPRARRAPSAVPSPRRTSARVRRRRALVGAVLLLAPPLGLLGGGSLTSAGQASASASGAGRTYVVRPGDTLWSIAERLSPGADPRPLVDDLTAQLGGGQLQAGERLILP